MQPYAALSPGLPHLPFHMDPTILHLRSYECLEGNLFNLWGAVSEVSSKNTRVLHVLACVAIVLIWTLQSRLLLICTPRYFWADVDSRGTSITFYAVNHGFFLCYIWRTKHLDLLKDICHDLSQPQSEEISFCSLAQSPASSGIFPR